MDPSVLGLIAGALHHTFIQFPTQAKLFTTVYAFAGTNVVFFLLLFKERDTPSGAPRVGEIIRDVVIFNVFYVPNHMD